MNGATSRKLRLEAHGEAQRERILCAARKCFIENGFHAASMASIAETAGISAGLVYRYFESKNAIILTIIKKHIDEIHADIRELRFFPETLEQRIVERFISWRRNEGVGCLEPGLFLEVVALGTRDPQVATALQTADQGIRAELYAWLLQTWQRAGHELTEAEILQRIFVLQGFFEGLVLCSIKQPDVDLTLLKESLRPLLAYLLPERPSRD
jgi:AcrR family transcriptional regulator